METQKKEKVDVAAIMERANAKTKAVKESTETVKGKTNNFKIVPDFTKYEFNGVILRNVVTKAIIKFKTGRTKYQINDDKGKSHNLSNDDLKKMFPAEETKLVKEKKPKVEKVKKVKVSKVEIGPNIEEEKLKVADLSKKEIIAGDHKNHKTHYMLHLKGCTVTEINELTKKPIPSIKRDIWRYQVGKTVL